MTTLKITIPDMGDFKDVEIIEVLVEEGQTIKKYKIDKNKEFPTKL